MIYTTRGKIAVVAFAGIIALLYMNGSGLAFEDGCNTAKYDNTLHKISQ